MERILVSMGEGRGAWEAFSRAISLAKRIEAKIYVLFVASSTTGSPIQGIGGATHGSTRTHSSIRERLELMIQAAKSNKLSIDYFITEGGYEEEVIRFIDQNRITLIILESAVEENRHLNNQSSLIRWLRHRSSCRVEVVSLRK